MPPFTMTPIKMIDTSSASGSERVFNLVIHKTFLELVDCKALSERTSRRRVRSLDLDRPSFCSKPETSPCTSTREVDYTATTSATHAHNVEFVDAGRPELCLHESSSTVNASSPCDEVAPPDRGLASICLRSSKHKRSFIRAINWPEQELSNIKARLDGATTVIVQNLRQDVTQAMFHQVIDAMGFSDAYDFLYLPTCFQTRESNGYGFVNFLNSDLAASFTLACAQREIRVNRAATQGRDAYVNRASNWRVQRVRNSGFKPIIVDRSHTDDRRPSRV
eukprot:TRINITY_DN24131_c0_g2_i5.p1 TRINITY_DN24131_c0_g2~~TRINITY_DN24131_c0_g2_i5.p1  ORF type:complete len:278 (-),score=32.27 TRINITY_DN24131_c0_g2_i5:392-1225(-)